MGIRGRLFFGFGLVLARLGGITALSYVTLDHTAGSMRHSAESQTVLAATTAEMARRVREADIALLAASTATDAQDGKDQAGELAQVTGAVGRVDAMTQQNAALVEQGGAAADSLREEAVRLKQAVGNFHLEETGSPLLLASR